MADVAIEEAGPGAVHAVTDLAERFFGEEAFELPSEGLESRVAQYVALEGQAVFLARGDEGPIGFATVASGFGLEYGPVAELEDLYVVPERRRSGVARALVARVADWAADRGCSAVLVTVTPEGEAAHALGEFYARLGFRDRGRRLLERPLP
ncbi:MAG: GNAT family N-acetyltransferase [Actinomycetota bacterium]